MFAIAELAQKIIDLDVDKILRTILNDAKFKEFILDLNRIDQLFEQGEDSTGKTLESIGGPYAAFTIEEKKKKGQPTDRVTLKDTGDFYKSFNLKVGNNFFEIDADPIKDKTNLFKEWGEDILGLQDENLQKLIDILREKITEAIRASL